MIKFESTVAHVRSAKHAAEAAPSDPPTQPSSPTSGAPATASFGGDAIDSKSEAKPLMSCLSKNASAKKKAVHFEDSTIKEADAKENAIVTRSKSAAASRYPKSKSCGGPFSKDELAARLQEPDTTGFSEADKKAVLSVKSQKALEAAQLRAKDPEAAEQHYNRRPTAATAADDLEKYLIITHPHSTLIEKVGAYIDIGSKDRRESPITHPSLTKRNFTRDACIYEGALIAHNRLTLDAKPLHPADRDALESMRDEAVAIMSRRLEVSDKTMANHPELFTEDSRIALDQDRELLADIRKSKADVQKIKTEAIAVRFDAGLESDPRNAINISKWPKPGEY